MAGKSKKLEFKPPLQTCKECGEEVISLATKVAVSIRCAGIAIEIVADDVCLDCLKEAITI